jgi:predicted nucleic acid-binding Zn ribbon protein
MPILEADTTMLKQECLTCGGIHTIPLRQGYSKSRKEPYVLADGDTLEVKVDGGAPQIATFRAADFADIAAAVASEVAAKLNTRLAGAAGDVDGGAIRIVSASTAALTTAVEVTGGTARDRLGFDGRRCGARLLGVTKGQGSFKRTASDTIDLPHCHDCGSKECLVRTWDTAPVEVGNMLTARHRRVVNALAEHLKELGHSDPDSREAHGAEKRRPPDIDSDFAARRITLPSARMPSREERAARGGPRTTPSEDLR